MFKGFKPQGLQKIATRMGYAGNMENFDDYLKQNPDKEREMIVFRAKAQEMARGGSVVRMANGGAPLFGTVGTASAPMMSSPGFDPRYEGTDQQSSGQQNRIPTFDYLYGQTPPPAYLGGDPEPFYRPQPGETLYRTDQAAMAENPNYPGLMPRSTVEPREGGQYAMTRTGERVTVPLGFFGTAPGGNRFQAAIDQRTAPQLVDPRDAVSPTPVQSQPSAPDIAADTNAYMDYFVLPDGTGFAYNRLSRMAIPEGAKGVSYDEYLKLPQQKPLSGLQSAPQQAYVPTLGESAGQIPAYGTAGAPKQIGEVATNLAQTGAIPVGAVTQPELTATNQQQIIDPTTGQLTSTPVAPTYGAETAGAIAPTTVTSTAMEAVQAAPAVQTAIQTNQAAQANVADPRAQVLAAQQTASSVSNLQAAQGTATLINNPVQRQIQSGELISGGVADAQTASNFTEQIQSATATPSEKATVQGQLATLTANFDATNPPAWAAGAIRGVQAMMQQRGLGASSMAGQALIQGVFESALPIAQADAQVTAQFEAQNLSNRQQRAMLAAQQRATFIGQEFDQAFQTRVANAAKIGDIANMNFTSDQQVMLENSRTTNTMNLNNLSNRQAMVIAEASALANMDLSNLSNAQQASVQNASNFLQLDMANLSNEQQTALFNAQAINQSILTDQAAQNAANQFNATSQNQVDQFMANLANQVAQFNATQTNAQNQFNAGELNTLSRFNAEVANQRDQFNAQNQLAIAQNNAVWRREIATADTATINRANELNAKAVLDVSNTQYDNLWNYYADTMEWAWKSAESEQERIKDLVVANLDKEAKEYQAQLNSASQGGAAIGNLIGTLGGAALQFGFGNVFS